MRRIRRREFVGATLACAVAPSCAWAEEALNRRAAKTENSASIDAVGLSGKRISLARADVDELSANLRGQLILPGDPPYDQARRLWNGAFDRHPALIVQCVGAADV